MNELVYEPVSNAEAAAALLSKPVVFRDTFSRLVPELRARAFTVSLVDKLDAVQGIRDAIAELPQGAAWEDVKTDVLDRLSPWLDGQKAEVHAEMLLRLHGFQAYATAQEEALATPEMRRAFPFAQYVAVGDETTRPGHRALDGLILPADHPFWHDHTPPWEWFCRCRKIPVSQEDRDAALKAKRVAGQAPAQDPAERNKGWVLTPAQEKDLQANQRLDWGGGNAADVRSPVARAVNQSEKRKAYAWDPRDMRLPLPAIRERYDDYVWNAFRSAAQNMEMELPGGRRTVWDWMLDVDRNVAAKSTAAFGARRGREFGIVLDYSTGEHFARVPGAVDRVPIGEVLAQARRDKKLISLVHNHPSGSPPSPADVALLFDWSHVVKDMSAVSGTTRYTLRPGRKFLYRERRFLADQTARWQNTVTPATWAKLLAKYVERGDLKYEIVHGS